MDIKRYPVRKNDPLQAWDSADELILEYLQTIDLKDKRILILNDHFGALSCNLIQYQPTVYTDSFVSMKAILLNSNNRLQPVSTLSSLEGFYDIILIRIPKSMSFFEDILCHLSFHIKADSKIICGSMVKHLAASSFELLQKYLGETSTSLAKKKARLVFAAFQKTPVTSPYPINVKLDSFEKPFFHHSNLFSREKLDIGTRFFLDYIPKGPFSRILDLGCANGILGIKAKMLNPQSQIDFSDESYMAIQSAEMNYRQYFTDQAKYHWTNCFEDGSDNTLDLVLCNPPFHQGNTIGDFIAWQMFQDSYRCLKSGGKILIVGNSHLGYHHKLKKIFGQYKLVASNKKFVILEATK